MTLNVKSTMPSPASGNVHVDVKFAVAPLSKVTSAWTTSVVSTPISASRPRVVTAVTDSIALPFSHMSASRVCGIRNHAGDDNEAQDSICVGTKYELLSVALDVIGSPIAPDSIFSWARTTCGFHRFSKPTSTREPLVHRRRDRFSVIERGGERLLDQQGLAGSRDVDGRCPVREVGSCDDHRVDIQIRQQCSVVRHDRVAGGLRAQGGTLGGLGEPGNLHPGVLSERVGEQATADAGSDNSDLEHGVLPFLVNQKRVNPPSIFTIEPVMKLEASLARKIAAGPSS